MISADAIRGYVDLMVLSLLREGPSYAYELAQRITAIGGDDYSIKQTTLYSAVKRLEAGGLVSASAGVSPTGKPRTYYRITEAGVAHVALKTEEWHHTKTVVDRFVTGTAQGGTP
ncbi:PadR family transcriptional regulator [Demequina sp. NBRC 110053]|uniref:PadR family transcriptional regulator n=1 Tax=Demequina sp. NBRC 110053 TaxID=1570342 RepID=UPI0009FC83A4|nr:PadR family transcriptional regulator [Demequina sp. NBRC 110053]